jgi:hypothetical protein
MDRRTSIAFAVLLVSGCATQSGNDPGNGGFQPATEDASSPASDSGGTGLPEASTKDSGGGVVDAAPEASTATVALPFFVSDVFAPSGFMGDSQASQTAITLSHDASQCKTPRQSGAGGDCYSVTWAPIPPDGGSSWAGVYWQAPANNWGAKQGKPIPAGATKVSFYAAGAVGGETIQTCAGGINATGASASLPYGDTFTVKSTNLVLTTTWTQYEISLQGATYTDGLGGFCWVAAASHAGPVTFYIDDVKWE